MIGIVETITTPDGKKWVSLEDYQRLVKMYEDAVGYENNDDIIARAGEDEVPDK